MSLPRRLAQLLVLLFALVVLALAGVLALSHFDARFRVSDWRVLLSSLTGMGAPAIATPDVVQGYRAPAGLSVTLYAGDVAKARMLRLTSEGDLLVSQPRLGQILLLGRDANGDGQPDRREVLLSGLDRPHGLDLHDGWLYVAEGGSVGRVRFDSASGQLAGTYQTIVRDIPAGENHWTRTLRAGADGWIYVSIGSSCNACIETHDWRAAMIRFRPDGSGVERYAHGLRNSVGFDWAPWSGELYATDNGRDLLGDDFPPCELNHIKRGGFYGWPYVNGADAPDPDFGTVNPELARRTIPPVHAFAAHNAPLGMSFLRAPVNVGRFGRAAVVALHGSWNRSTLDGYKLVLLQWDKDGSAQENAQEKITRSDFLTGFILDGKVLGRPVDVVEAPDGSLFVSDDYANAIYRVGIPRGAPQTGAAAAQPVPSKPKIDALAGVTQAERTQAVVRAGELRQQHGCVGCHVPGSDLAAKWETLDQRYSLADMTAFFLTPTPPMPVLPLSSEDRRALAIDLLIKAGASAPK